MPHPTSLQSQLNSSHIKLTMTSSPITFFVILFIFSFHLAESLSISKHKRNWPSNSLWTSYEHCPPDFFINGISLIFSQTSVAIPSPTESPIVHRRRRTSSALTFTPVLGLNVSCSSIYPSEPDLEFESYPPQNESTSDLGNLLDKKSREIQKCEFPTDSIDFPLNWDSRRFYGMVAGIQSNFISQSLTGLNVFCNNKESASLIEPLDPNFVNRAIQWKTPQFCPWGHYACGVKLRYNVNSLHVMDVKTDCCRLFTPNPGWKSYRGETAGRVLSSYTPSIDSPNQQPRSHKLDKHYASQLDDPFYFSWDFCPVGSYVTGLQGHLENRQFRLSCSDISEPAPRPKSFLDTPPEVTNLNTSIAILSQWEEEDKLTPHVECEGGVVIGFQVLYSSSLEDIHGIRLFCSYSKVKNNANQLEYIKVLLPPPKNPTEQSPPTKQSNEEVPLWGQTEMCKRGEAVCGWKSREIADVYGHLKGTEHFKVKCCRVPSMAEICAPHDDYELVLECDARKASADTTCMYTLNEGFTITTRVNEQYASSNNLRKTLSNEWGLTESDTHRHSQETGSSSTDTNSSGSSGTSSRNSGRSSTSSDTTGESNSNSTVDTTSINKGQGSSIVDGITNNKGKDSTASKSTSSSAAKLRGFSSSNSHTRSSGNSENFLRTTTAGGSIADSSADTVGSSSGFVAAHTINEGTSGTSGFTEGDTESSSFTRGTSLTREVSGSETQTDSLSVGAEAGFSGFGVTATVRTNMEMSFATMAGFRVDNSENESRTKSKETSRSRNVQYTSDRSNSRMNQETRDSQKSNTKTVNRENNFGQSNANGGEQNRQRSDVSTNERNSQDTLTRGSDSSKSEAVREDTGISMQKTSQVNVEENKSTQTNRGNERSISRQLGTQRDDSVSASLTRNTESSASRGKSFSDSKSVEGTRTKSGSNSNSRERAFTTGYDWSRSSEKTWRVEKTFQVSMVIPPGMRTRLFQVVGYCAHFQARTNNFRRIDDYAANVRRDFEEPVASVNENNAQNYNNGPPPEENINEEESQPHTE